MAFKRLRILVWIFVALFAAVEARLFHLQFAERGFWEAEARRTRTGGRAVPFQRGAILDRYGRPLAEGRTVHNVAFRYHEFRRNSPIGLLIGANRMLTVPAHGDDGAVFVRDVLADPDWYARNVFARDGDWLAQQSRVFRGDFVFYLGRLLDLTETEVRERIEASSNQAFTAVFPGVVPEIADRARDQERAIRELAETCEEDGDEILLALDEHLAAIDAAVEATLARLPESTGLKQARAVRKDRESREVVLIKSIPYRSVFLLNLVPERYRGFEVRDVDARDYPEDVASLAPLLIGRTGYPTPALLEDTDAHETRLAELLSRPPEEIDIDAAEEIDLLRSRLRYFDYTPDEEMGISGLEALLEPVLRGRRGWKIEEWDRLQRHKQLLHMERAQDGQDVVLTLDASLQIAAERVLAERAHPAAIVLIDPRDGAIRALAAWPNPQRDDIRRDYAALVADRRLYPLFHRAYDPPSDLPRPASAFKLVTAAAALERGVLTADRVIRCDGTFRPNSREVLQCAKKRAHGDITLDRAMEKSCNCFFYKIALEIGKDALFDMAERFGLGQPTGFGDPDRLGLGPPSRGIKESVGPPRDVRWDSEIMRACVGQDGFGDLNPLQFALMAAPYANGGYRVHPYLIDEIGGRRAPREARTPIGLSPSTIDAVRRGMIKVTGGNAGTAGPDKGVDLNRWGVVGKTGTPIDLFEIDGRKELVYHACFTGFFPFDYPKLVFAVYGENVGNDVGGGSFGNPLLGALLQQPEMADFLEGRVR